MEEVKCYTVKDIQRIMNISRPTVYELFKRKEFPVKRAGRGYRVTKSAFDEWLLKIEDIE